MNPSPQMDVVVKTIEVTEILLNNVQTAVDMTFSSIYSEGVEFLGAAQVQESFDGIVGIISLVGDISCSVAIGLPRNMAGLVSKKFIGFDIDYNSEDMGDMIGELVNIAGGDLLARLDADGIKTELSLPTATRGNPLKFLVQEKTKVMCIKFKCPDGVFWVDIALNSLSQNNAQENISNKQSEKQERYDMVDASGGQDVKFSPEEIEGMKQSVLKTFGSMVGEDVQFTGFTDGKEAFNGIVGIVSLVGHQQTWSLMLGFTPESALKIGEKFAGFEIDYDSDDMGDVIGELANVVAGDAAAQLYSLGIKAELSIPTIARGREMNMLLAKDVAKMHYSFKTRIGNFWMKLATERH
ncbi:chemotaxis protein CheX [candidate division KSB1 bacterium]|nr:chemotaxis protein CheX [candidate division KSB1 bacterium]